MTISIDSQCQETTDVNGDARRCILASGHEGPHLTCGNIEWGIGAYEGVAGLKASLMTDCMMAKKIEQMKVIAEKERDALTPNAHLVPHWSNTPDESNAARLIHPKGTFCETCDKVVPAGRSVFLKVLETPQPIIVEK